MNIKIGNIFESHKSTLVNTVNCVGVMGKGIALEFKKHYPFMYKDYVNKCANRLVKPGCPYFYRVNDKLGILNFPTKDHWKSPSKLSYIQDGLDWFVNNYESLGITSIAFPPLGCGNGGLTWEIVGPLMYYKLKDLPIDVEIYAPYGTSSSKITLEYLASNMHDIDVDGRFVQNVNNQMLLILKVIRDLNDRKYALSVGRTIYQKICYVLTRNGVNTGFVFSKANYGPYSSQAKEAITALANANLIYERPFGRMISINVSNSVIINPSNYSQREWEATNKTVDLFARIKNTNQAEMMATILYSYDQCVLLNKKVTDKMVYDYVLDWKPYWESERKNELIDGIRNLAMLSQISIEHSSSFEFFNV